MQHKSPISSDMKVMAKDKLFKHSGSIPRNACIACKTKLCVTDYQKSVTTGQTDRQMPDKVWLPDTQTDRCRTKWSLCDAMLRRRHKKDVKLQGQGQKVKNYSTMWRSCQGLSFCSCTHADAYANMDVDADTRAMTLVLWTFMFWRTQN